VVERFTVMPSVLCVAELQLESSHGEGETQAIQLTSATDAAKAGVGARAGRAADTVCVVRPWPVLKRFR